MPPAASAKDAKDAPPPPITLAFGQDRFLVEQAADSILEEYAPDIRENPYSVTKISGLVDRVDDALAVLSSVRAALQQPDFFSPRTVVWLRDLSFSQAPQSKDKASSNDNVKDALSDFADFLESQGLPDGCSLLITSCSIGKATRLYKALDRLSKAKGAPRARIVDCKGGDSNSVKKLVSRVLTENAWKMDAGTIDEFINRVGMDSATIVNELNKLFTYTGGKEPTIEDIVEICTPAQGAVIWELLNAFGKRDLNGCLKVVDALLTGKKNNEVVGMAIQTENRLFEISLAVAAREDGLLAADGRGWAPNLPPDDAEAIADLDKYDVFAKPPFQRHPILEQARRWNGARCLKARIALMHANERLTSTGLDQRTIFESALAAALQ